MPTIYKNGKNYSGGAIVDSVLSSTSTNPVQNKVVKQALDNKVDKVEGKGLSTNDYTDDDKNKLAGIEAGANKTVVDFFMNDYSTNPLQNRVINAFLNEKTDVNNFNALTQEIELFNTYDLSNDVEISVFANETYKRDKYYDRSYETHIPNLDGEYSVSLGDKTFTETCTFTIANEGKSITEVFHTNRKYILGAKLLKAENDEVGDAHVIADVVTLIISKDAPYTTTFDPDLEHPPARGVLTLKVSVKPDEKYVNTENTGGPSEYAYWGSYNGSDLLIDSPILTYSETTFGQPKVSGNPITINDAAEANAVDVSVDIEPVQDLHGYDAPWVGGAGKNKLEVTATTQTINGVTFTVNNDGTVLVNGTATGNYARLNVGSMTFEQDVTYTLNGCPSGGGGNSYVLFIAGNGDFEQKIDNGSGISFTPSSTVTTQVAIIVYLGAIVANLKFYPMIRTSGDATFAPYSNICPISGWDEVNVGVSGVNVWDEEWEVGRLESDGHIDSTGAGTDIRRTTSLIKIQPNTTYYQACPNSALRGRYAYYDASGNLLEYNGDGFSSRAFTTPQGAYGLCITFGSSYGTTYNNDISINYPSTDTEYHAYKGKTYTIDLDRTRYGGTLDVVSGVLTVDRAIIDLGSCAWDVRSESVIRCAVSAEAKFESQYKAVNGICSAYIIVAQNSLGDGKLSFNNSTQIYLQDNSHTFSTQSDAQQYLNGQKLVYELATPLTIQLTPQQIRMLKGTNNLSCNTGNLTIKYYPDNVLGQLKGDIEDEYDDRVETLETQVQPSLIFMSRERRDITSDLSRLSTAVAEQNLAKYGYKIGDYFTGASRYTYILADYNTFKGTSTPYCLTQNHLGIVVDTHQTSQWHSGDASSVGYNGSTLHTYLKDTVMNNIKADMIALFGGSTGLEHLLSHNKLLTTALANWAWRANQYISALTCTQIDAGSQWTANGFQEGEASKSLELFRKYKWTEIFGSEYLWLRDLSNYDTGGSFACYAYHNGFLYGGISVTDSNFVVGLINFY